MTYRFLWAALLMVAISGAAFGQSSTKVVQTLVGYNEYENYSVLTANETIKHGSFVHYSIVPGRRDEVLMHIAGQYEAGAKVGEWRTFWRVPPFNRLESKGNYQADQREGLWMYYFAPERSEPSWKIYADNASKSAIAFDIQDTISVAQVKGQYRAGRRVGVWKYYDRRKRLVQAVSEPGQRLVYWEQPGAAPVSSEETANNHPVLYLGGDDALKKALYEVFNPVQVLGVKFKAGDVNTAVIAIAVDSLGKKTGVSLAANPPRQLQKYEKLVLEQLAYLSGTWLPKTVNGVAKPANFRVSVETVFSEKQSYKCQIDLLGE